MESQLNTTWKISLVSYVALQCTEHNALRVLHSYFSGAEKLYLSKGVSELRYNTNKVSNCMVIVLGNTPRKKNVFFQAMPKLPPPPPSLGLLDHFFEKPKTLI